MRQPTTISLILLAACGSNAPSTATVHARLSSDLANVLHNAKDAADGSTASVPGSTATALANTALGGMASLPAMPAIGSMTGFDPDAAIQWLDDNIFTDANKVDDGVYRVPPELFCTTTTIDSSGNTVSSVDPDCANRISTAQLRVRVEEDGATLRFSLQVDPNHDEPLSFALSHTSLAITVDLDDAGNAIISLAQAFGQPAPNVSLSGQITGKLEILGPQHASASLSIDRALAVKYAPQGQSLDGDSATRFASAQATVFSIEGDANAPLLAVDLGLGETTMHTPGDPGYTKSTDLDLGGLTANATYAGGNAITVDHISLGTKTTTVAKDGVQAIAVDLNANDGRSLSASVTADPATGIETLTVSPRLDLQVSTNHAALGDIAPEYDITRFLLDGSLAGAPGTNVIKVASGSFAISTSPAQFGFSASAGQCVTSTATYDSTTLNDYTAYSVATCP